MRAAIEAFDAGADVAMISKLHPTRSHSGAAEGGINAALGNASEDDPETHSFDTVKGSDYLGDQDSIEIFTREAPEDIIQLERWGAFFSRTPEGRIAQRPFGAGRPRTAHAADITGHVLIQVLYEQLQKRMVEGLKVYEEFFAFRLVVDHELPGEELLVAGDLAPADLLVQDLDQDVAGDVGRVRRPRLAGRAERALRDPPVLGA